MRNWPDSSGKPTPAGRGLSPANTRLSDAAACVPGRVADAVAVLGGPGDPGGLPGAAGGRPGAAGGRPEHPRAARILKAVDAFMAGKAAGSGRARRESGPRAPETAPPVGGSLFSGCGAGCSSPCGTTQAPGAGGRHLAGLGGQHPGTTAAASGQADGRRTGAGQRERDTRQPPKPAGVER